MDPVQPRNLAHHLAGLGVHHVHLHPVRDVEPVRHRIHREVIPGPRSADLPLVDHLVRPCARIAGAIMANIAMHAAATGQHIPYFPPKKHIDNLLIHESRFTIHG